MVCPTCKKECSTITGSYVNGKVIYNCKFCSQSNYKKLHSLKNCDTFHAHYDAQLGQFFESREQKRAYLKATGMVQVSGTESPKRTEGRGRLVCSEGQYRNNAHKL